MTLSALFRNPFGSRSANVPLIGTTPKLDVSDAPPDVRRLIRDHQYFHVLAPTDGVDYDDVSIACAWRAVEHEMALVPQGDTQLRNETASAAHGEVSIDPDDISTVTVDACYIDRTAVTNAQYHRFVQAGCYTDADLWPEDILPMVLQFVDQSGRPGPRTWDGGEPSKDMLDHPVIGISWYEANAYAKWIGKRLPTSAEWQRSATWSRNLGNATTEVRYPWGNSFDGTKANLWASGIRTTVPVTEYASGDTANGVRQLVGNVWEWVNTQYFVSGVDGVQVFMEDSMGEIRGGAFDTYFRSQATNQFRTGQPLTCRRPNLGFRCCRGLEDLAAKTETIGTGDAS